jgi:hypothetical protein
MQKSAQTHAQELEELFTQDAAEQAEEKKDKPNKEKQAVS